jgi:hypothetical protein
MADYRRRMASARRDNLRQGVAELAERKRISENQRIKRREQTQQRRERALYKKVGDDERLTRQSVSKAVRYLWGRAGQELPRSKMELDQSRQRYEQLQQKRSRERVESLHTLYMHARNFIVSEAGLTKAVEEAFGDKEPVRFGGLGKGESVWDLGVPESVQMRLGSSEQFAVRASLQSPEALEERRLRRLAEELTGGKA